MKMTRQNKIKQKQRNLVSEEAAKGLGDQRLKPGEGWPKSMMGTVSSSM